MPDAPSDLPAEDAKIVLLARSARARTGAADGAAVRDTDGRTYAAAAVSLSSLRLSAVQVAVATALSSGAQGLEAVARSGAGDPAPGDGALVREVGGGAVTVLLATAQGDVHRVTTAGELP